MWDPQRRPALPLVVASQQADPASSEQSKLPESVVDEAACMVNITGSLVSPKLAADERAAGTTKYKAFKLSLREPRMYYTPLRIAWRLFHQ